MLQNDPLHQTQFGERLPRRSRSLSLRVRVGPRRGNRSKPSEWEDLIWFARVSRVISEEELISNSNLQQAQQECLNRLCRGGLPRLQESGFSARAAKSTETETRRAAAAFVVVFARTHDNSEQVSSCFHAGEEPRQRQSVCNLWKP